MALAHACTAFIEVEDLEGVCDLPPWVTHQDLIDAASDVICVLSGGLISGRCSITVRPRSDMSWCGVTTYTGAAIILPGYRPTVTSVKVDGVSLTAGVGYRVVNGNEVWRIDGYWPGSQTLQADTETGTFSITYSFGMEPPLYAKLAAHELVARAALTLATPTGHPRGLPDGTIQVTADQVTMQIDPNAGDLGIQGLAQVMAVYAPDEPGGTAVWSPELMSGWTLDTVSA
jgi:hypothetical protein